MGGEEEIMIRVTNSSIFFNSVTVPGVRSARIMRGSTISLLGVPD